MFNLAVLGCGKIAQVFISAAKNVNGVCLYACASRDKKRAEEYKNEYGFEKAYGSYEEMVKDKNIDLVYVATPISLHYEQVMLCLKNDKNVLCEKCFTENYIRSKELFDFAMEKKLFLAEAVWTLHLPFVKKLQEIIDSGKYGSVTEINCWFDGNKPLTARNFQYSLGGGALLDMGIYPFTFANIVARSKVKSISTWARMLQNVDACSRYEVEYENGIKAHLGSANDRDNDRTGYITLTKGKINIPLFWHGQSIVIEAEGEREEISCLFAPTADIFNGYRYELIDAIKCINEGKITSDIVPPETTLDMMKLFDEIRYSWNFYYECEKEKK